MSQSEPLGAVLYKNFPLMLYVAYRILRNREQAEDVCQTVAVKALNEPRLLQPDFNAKAWLVVSTRNTALKVIRSNTQRQRLLDTFGDPVKPSASSDPERTAQGTNIIRTVERLLPQMPLAFREVFRMTYLHHMAQQEIRDTLALNEATVRTRLHRGHAWVAEQLGTD